MWRRPACQVFSSPSLREGASGATIAARAERDDILAASQTSQTKRYFPPMPNPAPYVLVVDDFPDGREMLAEYLGFQGFTVVEATNGEAALALARERPPALILMDLQMPGMGGWEATRQLKADPRTRHIPVIALSAHAMGPDEGIARRAGCDGFLSKPFEIRAVGDAVEQVLRRARTDTRRSQRPR